MDKTIQKTIIFGVDNNNIFHKLVEVPATVSLSKLVIDYVFTKHAGLGADNKDTKAWELVYKALDEEENIVDEVASSLFSLQCFLK